MKITLDKPLKVLLLLAIPLGAVILIIFLVILSSRVGTTSIEVWSDGTPVADYAERLQIEILTAQLEENRNYNDRLLQIVLWSISGVLGTGALLLGFSWFSHYRTTEQERDRLREAERTLTEMQGDSRSVHETLTEMVLRSAMGSAQEETLKDNFPEAYRILCDAASNEHLAHASSDIADEYVKSLEGVLDSALLKKVPIEVVDNVRITEIVDLLSGYKFGPRLRQDGRIATIQALISSLEQLSQEDEVEPPNLILP